MSLDRARVHLTGKNARALRAAANAAGVDLCYGSARASDGAFAIDGLVPEDRVEEIRERLAAREVALAVVGRVSTTPPPLAPGDRFSRRAVLPQGLGDKE